MLKTDYKGFGEFMEKIKTAGEEETRMRWRYWRRQLKKRIRKRKIAREKLLTELAGKCRRVQSTRT